MSEQYDFVVIGGGSAGYAGASVAAGLGLTTAVIEGGEVVGGLCILRGCMPSKTLLESSHRAETIRRAAEFGLRAEYRGADAAAILQRKRKLIEDFAGYRRTQLETGKFDFIRGRARFVDPHTLEIALTHGGSRRVSSRTFLVATGSRVSELELRGLQETGFWTSDEMLDADRLPESVVVLGGGAIGLEAASYYAGLGTEVSVIQRGGQLLKEMDGDVAEALEAALRARGVKIFTNTTLSHVQQHAGVKQVCFDHAGTLHSVEGQEIVYALGRKPCLEGLGLENAGVVMTKSGLSVSASQQCSAGHIFAAGDVVGPLEVVHIAIAQGELAARNAARLVRAQSDFEEMDYALKLFAVFTQPEVAAVGCTEREAVARGDDFLTAKYPFADHGKSMVRGETEGFVKLIAERESRRLIGGAAVGPNASELIHEVAVAMHFRATAGEFAKVPHYHPTLSEIWMYPAEELAG